MNMNRIILASASPRRREILRKAGLKFTIDKSGWEEEVIPGMSPESLARFLSRRKAETVAARHRNALVIAADTFIVLEGKVLGKPRTKREAKKMLKALSGKSHIVITGLTIIASGSGRTVSRSVKTRVLFRRLRSREIESYIRSGEPFDKAGGYAIQGLGAAFIERIEGDFLNVVGLPLRALARALKGFSVSVSWSEAGLYRPAFPSKDVISS